MSTIESALSLDADDEEPPRCPSYAVVVVHHGLPFVAYHVGSDIEYWLGAYGAHETAMTIAPEADGAFLWHGNVRGWCDYWGEHDEELETSTLRACTAEEWQRVVEDDHPIDDPKIQERDAWYVAQARASVPR